MPAADRRKAVDSLSEIDGLYGVENFHVGVA